MSSCSPDDQIHFIRYQALYVVFKHLQDLKYIGLPWKTRQTGQLAIGFFHPDPIWTEFFQMLRGYLKYPQAGHADHLRDIVEIQTLPASATEYLKQLYSV